MNDLLWGLLAHLACSSIVFVAEHLAPQQSVRSTKSVRYIELPNQRCVALKRHFPGDVLMHLHQSLLQYVVLTL